jgi:DNA-binding MarR family transcriptional regulator
MTGEDEVPDLERIDRALGELIRVGLGQIRAGIVADEEIPFELSTFEVLATVVDAAPVRVSDLAPKLGLDISSISRHAFKLEQLGLLVRRADPEDRRVGWFEATSAGARLVERRVDARRAALLKLLRTWSPKERQVFGELLEKFTRALERPTRLFAARNG